MSTMNEGVPDPVPRDQPLSFADLGIPSAPKVANTFIIGTSRRIQDLEKTELLFIVLSWLTILAAVALSSYKMATVSVTNSDFTFALVILVNAVFCAFYVAHGVLRERAYEIVILLIAVLIILLYTILNYTIVVDDRGPIKLARMILVCIVGPVIILFSVKFGMEYYKSGHLVFRIIGANSELQDICKTLYLYLDLLKLDLQLGVTIIIFILNSTPNIEDDDILILSVGGVFSILWFGAAYYSSRYENHIGILFVFLGSFAEPAYVLYKMIKSVEQVDINLKSATLACGGLAICCRILIMVFTVLVDRNFGKGLKQKLFPSSTENDTRPINESESDSYTTYNTLKVRRFV